MYIKYFITLPLLAFCFLMPVQAGNLPADAAATAAETVPTNADSGKISHSTQTGWWQRAQNNIAATWASNEYEVLIPLRIWHNRSKYSKEKIREFNEQPWGLGVGKVRDDEHGNTHSLFLMTFADSHNDPETMLGYAWQKNWNISTHQKVSLGAFGGLTSRSDIMHYTPIPVAWPYVSYSYRKFSLQGMYFPGSKGNGNIAFFWARYRF